MTKQIIADMVIYSWESKPARLQTRSGWIALGWRVVEPARPEGSLKTNYQKYLRPVFDYQDVIPIPGAKALDRRIDFMLAYLDGVMRKQGESWMNGHVLVGLVTDEDIADTAAYHPIPLAKVFFAREVGSIPEKQFAQRAVWAFEEGALKAQGRTFAEYAYSPF